MKSKQESVIDKINFPELVFGLVAPIGVDLDTVTRFLTQSLSHVNYTSSSVKLTVDTEQFEISVPMSDADMFAYYDSRILRSNAIRAKSGRDDALALLAIASLRRRRQNITGNVDDPAPKQAYIIRQFKRPEEIELMRRVYGPQYVTICIYQSEVDRIKNLMKDARADKYKRFEEGRVAEIAKELIDRDYAEQRVTHGQRIRDAFPKGDVFIDASDVDEMQRTITRFIEALFGHNCISPTIEEYGMYLAKSASLRSLDLSRQVGAAILTERGEVIALGSNEVPKAGGGTYWYPEDESRDIFQGYDPNETEKTRILLDVVSRMKERKIFSDEIERLVPDEILRRMLSKDDSISIGDARVLDIIEFGRIIHAEMSAISDAARLGRKVEGSHLYCTTFPCHICAKHIVAAGVMKVVFLEPYPKSHAVSHHADSIVVDQRTEGKVWFKPFIGIAPSRYQSLFEKNKRKDEYGKSKDWYEGEPMPRMAINTARTYIEAEKLVESGLFSIVAEKAASG
ncbi:MAG: deoxycytidylate deaminase [Hyphomicrobiales bacterium]|nr:deoxycytidylate deaminase [Hyphomicrobiales bacterium]